MADEQKAQENQGEEKKERPVARRGAPANREMSRRVFLRNVMWGSVLGALFTTAFSGLALFWPRKITGFGAIINAGHIDDFPVGSVTRVRDGQFFISRLSEDELIALWWRCPHLGCTVPWDPGLKQFACPCHGSRYTTTGQNVAGPAPRPMDYMNVFIEDDGTVLVDTGDIRQRNEHQAAHTTRIPKIATETE